MNGHPDQDAVAANRDPADAWRGIVGLCRDGNTSQINVAGISRRRAIVHVAERLEALESRNADAEKLARLITILLATYAYNHPDQHGPIREEIERLARELAPKENT